ncbi:MAG: response regulator [Desulfobacter sp.]|nr:response regulator [Desulfobacter sp.]WDP87433.1 MAG: response regulator [Desulfobacter sp.]
MSKILFVDDEKAFLDTLIKRLEKRKINPRAVYSGEEALTFLAENTSTDVVVLDVKMPGMDGLETLSEIKKQFPLVEVIMLTGHATVESAIDGMKLGAFDYMMKPCDLDLLMEKLDKAVAKKQGHEEKIMEARLKEIAGQRV